MTGLFQLDFGRYPSQQEGLRALVQPPPGLDRWAGPYLTERAILADPWGRPFVYRMPGRERRAYELYTLGPDGDATGPPDPRGSR